MVAKNKATTGKGQIKKLKLKRETIKSLDPQSRTKDVKGGVGNNSVHCGPTYSCVASKCVALAC